MRMVMELINCAPQYWDFVRRIRNDNVGFVEQVQITYEQQKLYMEKHDHEYKICLVHPAPSRLLLSLPAGFIGEVDNDIRFGVDQKFRNRGVGTFMLNNFPISIESVGRVKKDPPNIPSSRLFVACGWTQQPSDGSEFIVYKNEK